MSGQVGAMQIELTERGYLILPVEVAERYFPGDSLVAIPRGQQLWLLPIQGQESGGLLMKRRNLRGDRSVLLVEVLGENARAGHYQPHWDEAASALIIDLFQEARSDGREEC